MGTDRRLRVLALVDPMSAGAFDYSTDVEYESMRKALETFLGVTVDIEGDVPPQDLSGRSFDAYVIDYGGMGLGCEDLTISVIRAFAKAADEHPGKPFIVYSSFSVMYYEFIVKEELDAKQENVFFWVGFRELFDEDAEVVRLQQWLGIEDAKPEVHKLVTPGRGDS